MAEKKLSISDLDGNRDEMQNTLDHVGGTLDDLVEHYTGMSLDEIVAEMAASWPVEHRENPDGTLELAEGVQYILACLPSAHVETGR